MILAFVETAHGTLKKTALEVVQFASGLGEVTALALGSIPDTELAKLGQAGATKVLHIADEALNGMYSRAYTKAICAAAGQVHADVIVMSHSSTGKSVAPRVSVRMQCPLFAGVGALPENGSMRKTVFSGKAFADLAYQGGKAVISINPNSITPVLSDKAATVEPLACSFDDRDFDYTIKQTIDESGGHIPLPEAEIVVSGGRGMKGPENWGPIEELAQLLGAATACSRPVADVGWRPHHEHVGQTGITIKPNLYIAIGISGAIQHLAGVNQSKVIVVINKDPEAPFFKAADYGIVGDAFDVLPKLIEAAKKLKQSA
ncbi:MAG: electron transfer flavoprotein subunit alpha/FixB family protein [Chitinophagales bacterium]